MITLLAFAGLLRISEALKRAWTDIFLPFWANMEAVIYLGTTKTGQSEYVPIHDKTLIEWLRALQKRMCPKGYQQWKQRLCTLTYTQRQIT